MDSTSDRLRASHADRERVAEQLRLAVDDGRLTLSEYDERLRAAYAATTTAELAAMTADLPAARPATPVPTRARGAGREWAQAWRGWLGGAVIMIGIWAATSIASGDLRSFWPAIPLGIWAVVLLASTVGGRPGCGPGHRART
jgi:hypothetical protein